MAYINRELALKLLSKNSITKHITLSDGVSIYDTIANIPAADVAPRAEIAMEIFDELDKIMLPLLHEVSQVYIYAKLKKKYTEAETPEGDAS